MSTIPYFDAHCDTLSACAGNGRPLRQNSGHLDLLRMRVFSHPAQIFAIWADGGDFAECTRQHNVFIEELRKNGDIAARCVTGEDISAAHAAGKLAALLSVEGGELLDCDPDRLVDAAAWGVRCVNLTWNHSNALSGSHADRPERGLSDRGRSFVRRAEALGILLDISHLSDRGFRDLMKIASRPVIATHSDARAVCPHSRNLTDDMFREIRDSGGVVGLNLYVPFLGGNGTDDVLRHIDHFLALGGERTLCLGLDLDGCDALAGGLDGLQDLPLLWDALAARGYGDQLLSDIFYNNLRRLFS